MIVNPPSLEGEYFSQTIVILVICITNKMNLPTPSEEQQDALDIFKDGHNLKIEAVAGGGKTTTLLHLALNFFDRNPGSTILLLTYNKSLQLEINEKIRGCDEFEGLMVYTFHGYASRMFFTPVHNDQLLREKLVTATLKKKGYNVDELNLVLVDEVQDMTSEFNQLVNIILDHNTPDEEFAVGPQITIVGDERQCINQYMGSNLKYFSKPSEFFNSKREWWTVSLRTTYRLTPAIAEFINIHALGSPILIGGNLSSPNSKPIYYIGSYSFGRFVDKAVEQYGPEGVMILAPSVKKSIIGSKKSPLGKFVNSKHPYPMVVLDDYTSKESIGNKVLISTFNSVKGMERPAVFVMCFDESYFKYYGREYDTLALTSAPNSIYVALTRAMNQLYVVKSEHEDHFRTVDTNRLAMDARVYGVDRIKRQKVNGGRVVEKFVTDLIKHRKLDDIEKMLSLVKVTQLQPKGTQLKVNNLVQFPGYTEDVKSLYGILIPIYTQFIQEQIIDVEVLHTLGELDKVNQKDRRKTLTKWGLNDFVDIIKVIHKIMGKDNYTKPDLNIGEWMRLIVCIKSINDRCHFYFDQIDKFDWVNEQFITRGVERLINILPQGGIFEQELQHAVCTREGDEEFNITILGSVDYYLEDEMWEFKCVGRDLSHDHILQCAAYICLRRLSEGDEVPVKLYNIQTGEMKEIRVVDVEKLLQLLSTKEKIPLQ